MTKELRLAYKTDLPKMTRSFTVRGSIYGKSGNCRPDWEKYKNFNRSIFFILNRLLYSNNINVVQTRKFSKNKRFTWFLRSKNKKFTRKAI